jgi:uncharacterized membrane protein
MSLKIISRVGSLMVVFFFLPSLIIKIWQFVVYAPWPAKSWLVYLALGAGLIMIVRYRLKRRVQRRTTGGGDLNLLQIARERLVKGEISVAEFKEIRQELNE